MDKTNWKTGHKIRMRNELSKRKFSFYKKQHDERQKFILFQDQDTYRHCVH